MENINLNKNFIHFIKQIYKILLYLYLFIINQYIIYIITIAITISK